MNTQIEIGILPFSLNKSMNYNKSLYKKDFKFFTFTQENYFFSDKGMANINSFLTFTNFLKVFF